MTGHVKSYNVFIPTSFVALVVVIAVVVVNVVDVVADNVDLTEEDSSYLVQKINYLFVE